MSPIHWFEYGVPQVSRYRRGQPDDAHYLGCSRGAAALFPDARMFVPHGEELGLGFHEPHWRDWPEGFRGGLLFRAVGGREDLRFILGYVGEAKTNDGRGTSRALWYVLPNAWLSGPRKLSAALLTAVVEVLSRHMIAAPSGTHADGRNEPVRFDVSAVKPAETSADPWLIDLEKRAKEGLRFHGTPGTRLLDPPNALAAMIGAARSGAAEDNNFIELAEAGVAVLGESIEGTEFGWLVPYDIGLPVAFPAERRALPAPVPSPPLLPTTVTVSEGTVETPARKYTPQGSDRTLQRAYAWATIATLAAVVLALLLMHEQRRGALQDPCPTVSTTPGVGPNGRELLPTLRPSPREPFQPSPSVDPTQVPSGAPAGPPPTAAQRASGASTARRQPVRPPTSSTPQAATSTSASAAAPASLDAPVPPMTATVTTSSAPTVPTPRPSETKLPAPSPTPERSSTNASPKKPP